MPYTIAENDKGEFCTYKKSANGQPEGKTLGCHATKAEAVAQIGAIESSEHGVAKAGNMEGLAEHLSNKIGADPGFFTACMGDESLKDYDEETRSAVCAKAHEMVVGKWPAEKQEVAKASAAYYERMMQFIKDRFPGVVDLFHLSARGHAGGVAAAEARAAATDEGADVAAEKQGPNRADALKGIAQAIGNDAPPCVCPECGHNEPQTLKGNECGQCPECGERMKVETVKQDNVLPGRIIKSDAAQQKVWAVVLEPHRTDVQHDWLEPWEVEKPAHQWLADYGGAIGIGHKGGPTTKVKVVESSILLKDTEIGGQVVPAGSWVVAAHIRDKEIWERIQSGELSGFSIQGFGKRRQKALKGAKSDKRPFEKGGPGSGNFGHAGRPGEVGGSAPGGGAPAGLRSKATQLVSEQNEYAMSFDENGNVLFEKKGSPGQSDYWGSNPDQLIGQHLLHNHPRGLSFTERDVILAASQDVESNSVVYRNQGGTFLATVGRPTEGWEATDTGSQNDVNALARFNVYAHRIRDTYNKHYDAAETRHPYNAPETARIQAEIQHEAWQNTAAELGFRYTRVRLGD